MPSYRRHIYLVYFGLAAFQPKDPYIFTNLSAAIRALNEKVAEQELTITRPPHLKVNKYSHTTILRHIKAKETFHSILEQRKLKQNGKPVRWLLQIKRAELNPDITEGFVRSKKKED
jgi:hypothetical protein